MGELTLQAARRIDTRRIAVALAALWGVFAVAGLVVELGHGGWVLRAFDLSDSNLETRASMAAGFTALLLLVSSGIALALAGVDRSRRRRTWQLTGVALLAFGIEKLLGPRAWLDAHGVGWTFSYLPLLALGGAALYRTIRVFRSQRLVQTAFAGAAALWVVAGLLDNPDLLGSNAAAQLVAMASAALILLCLIERLRYLARQYYPLEERDTRLSLDQILAEAVDLVPLRALAIALLAATGVFAIQEVLLQTAGYGGHRVPILDLGGEQTIPATFQGALLALAGLLALVTGFLRATPAAVRRAWTLLGAVLVLAGVEEIVAFHDRLQTATDVPGLVVLIPLALAGFGAGAKVFASISGDRLVRSLLLAGALFWLGSQAIDLLVQDQTSWTVVPEETAETLGSICFVFAFAGWLRRMLPVDLEPLAALAARLDGPRTIEQLPAPAEHVATTG